MLQQTFQNLLSAHAPNNNLTDSLWKEIHQHYTHKKRHYHNLAHLEHLLKQLEPVRAKLQNRDTILFSLFYHDIIYNPLKSDNEEQSALLAEKRMKQLEVPTDMVEACKTQIMATKSHQSAADKDTDYFTDADLSILGQDWESYTTYYKNVRKEYAIYPTMIYNPGRRKVLQHFLNMDRIFKTDFFYHKFETQAKENLQKELALL
jgi:predicted metal-dependent HD superfamily phosphohydrolase